MFNLVNSIRDAWSMLGTPADSEQYLSQEISSNKLWAVKYKNRYGVFLKSDQNEHILRKQKGSLRLNSVAFDNIGHVLMMSSADSTHERAIAWLASDIFHSLKSEQGWNAQLVWQQISEWAALLHGSRSIQTIGLVGELIVMHQLVAQHGKHAWDWWSGPNYSVNDVMFPQELHHHMGAHAWEIKTTTIREGWTVKINGTHQLPQDGTLSLVCIRLERIKMGGFTLADLLADVPSGVIPEHFLEELKVNDKLDSEQWRILDAVKFPVNHSFPCITSHSFVGGTLPERVIKFTYDVTLNGLTSDPFSIIRTLP